MTAPAFDVATQYSAPTEGANVLWSPFPGMQTRALAAAEFEVLIGGAKGPGKSDILLMAGARQTNYPMYKAYITRETGPQLSELKDRTHRYFPMLADKPTWNGDGHGRWTWPSGAKMIFESIGTPDDAEKIQGKEPSFVGQDEVGNVPDERTIDRVQSEIRSPDKHIRLMWRGSANPGKAGQMWIKRRFINPCGRDGKRVIVTKVRLPNGLVGIKSKRFIPGTVLDNPIYANDALYMAQLWTLPEVLRNQLLFGDWDSGYGAALGELNELVHIVRPFIIPSEWVMFGGFDWGFAHNWVFVWLAADESGNLYVIDTVRGRRHLVNEIAERIHSRVPVARLRYITADLAVKQKNRSRGDGTPTIEEEMMEHNIILSQGNTARKDGLNNLRHYLAYKGLRLDGGDADPALRFFDTPGNRWLFEQMQAMVVDEDDMEDVLKVNADPDTGVGGDDGYDAIRVAVASRPPRAIGTFFNQPVQAFSPQTLQYMVDHLYKDKPLPMGSGKKAGSLYTVFGGV